MPRLATLGDNVGDFGRYQLERKLGQGGMAQVFLARQHAAAGAGRAVVIKRILPGFSEQPDFLALFVGEARLSMQLSHGNVVQVFDFGEVDGQYFLAMEFVDGLTLGALLDLALEKGLSGLPAPVAVIVAIEICKALHYAHRKADEHGQPLRVVHRDISPENVLISWEGQVKLSDFGIARAVMEGRERTRPDVFRGRLDFCAPEQARAEAVDARTDLYSVGVLLTTLVLGHNPVAPIALQVAAGALAAPPFPPSAVDEGFARLIDRCTAPSPAARFPDAQALHEALQRWLVANTTSNTVTALPDLLGWLEPEQLARRSLPPTREGFGYWLTTWQVDEAVSASTVPTDKVAAVTRRVAARPAPQRRFEGRPLLVAIAFVALGLVGVVLGVSTRGAREPQPVVAPEARSRVAKLDGHRHAIYVDSSRGDRFSTSGERQLVVGGQPALCTFFDGALKVLSTKVTEHGAVAVPPGARLASVWVPNAPGLGPSVPPSQVMPLPVERRASFDGLDGATTYEVTVDGDAVVLLALGLTSLQPRPMLFIDQPVPSWMTVVDGKGTHRFTGAQSLWATIITPSALGTNASSQVSLAVAPADSEVQARSPAAAPAEVAAAPVAVPAAPPPAPDAKPVAAVRPTAPHAGPRRPSPSPTQAEFEQTQLKYARTLIAANQLDEAVLLLESCVRSARGSALPTCYKLLGSTHAKLATRSRSQAEIAAARAAYVRYLDLAAPDDPDVPVVRSMLESTR